ncbi:MAG: rRNA maturation RNase YbeY [Chitinophagales bacterium]
MAISFHFENVKKPTCFKPIPIKRWLKAVAKQENFSIQDLNYIFLTDEELLEINIEYLNHHTYTDIITFDNSEKNGKIESDIFVSLERVEDNAKKFSTSYTDELYRVLVHGVLHLCGYKDKKKADQDKMRQKENEALELLEQFL